jgi:hypothetical protein
MPVPAQEAPAPVPGPAPATTAATAAASTTAPTPKAPTAGAKKAAVNPSSTPSYPVEPPAPLRVVGPAETWEKLWLGQNSLVRKLQQAVAAEEVLFLTISACFDILALISLMCLLLFCCYFC